MDPQPPSSPDASRVSSRRTAMLLLAASIGVGSVAFTFVKVALRELSPITLACGRVVSSALTFVAIVWAQPARRTAFAPGHRLRVYLCGLGGSAVFHILFAVGQQHASVAMAAVVMATFPVMVAVGEVVFLGHRLRSGQVAGLALAMAGCVAIGVGGGGESSALGVLLIGGSTLVWAAVTVATRSIADRYDSWWLNTPGTVLGAVVMLVVAAPHLHEFAHLSPKGWLVVVWLGTVSSAFIYFAYARVMTAVPATTASAISTVVTPSSVLVAWLVLGAAPSWREVLGGLVVIAGVVMVTREPTEAAHEEPALAV